MLQQLEMDLYHKHITSLTDIELDKEYESCKNGTGSDQRYSAAWYTELAKRKARRGIRKGNEKMFKSKILRPFRKLVRALIDVFYFSATGQGRE